MEKYELKVSTHCVMEATVFVEAVDLEDAMAKARNLDMFGEINYHIVDTYGFKIEDWRKLKS